VFTADDDVGKAFRRAVQIAKGMAPIEPVATGDSGSDADDNTALAALRRLVAAMRAANPELKLSDAQAFARVYSDPANAELVKRERAENRPVATW
jgi:hypothetical protein